MTRIRQPLHTMPPRTRSSRKSKVSQKFFLFLLATTLPYFGRPSLLFLRFVCLNSRLTVCSCISRTSPASPWTKVFGARYLLRLGKTALLSWRYQVSTYQILLGVHPPFFIFAVTLINQETLLFKLRLVFILFLARPSLVSSIKTKTSSLLMSSKSWKKGKGWFGSISMTKENSGKLAGTKDP